MKYYWKTKDGNLIDVDNMSENHLRNALKMIIRNKQIKAPVAKTRIGNIENNFFEEMYKEYEEDNCYEI